MSPTVGQPKELAQLLPCDDLGPSGSDLSPGRDSYADTAMWGAADPPQGLSRHRTEVDADEHFRQRRHEAGVTPGQSRETLYVGRRGPDAAEVYEVIVDGVERLYSEDRFRSEQLDWYAPDRDAMELAHILLSRVVGRHPFDRLVTDFISDMVPEFDGDGFALSAKDLAHWVNSVSSPSDWSSWPPPRRSWLARTLMGL